MIDTMAPVALSIKDAARALGLGESYIWILVQSGALPSFKLGKRRLISSRALAEFVQQQEAEAAQPAAAVSR